MAGNLRALAQRWRALAQQQAALAARERAAYRRGWARATAVAATIILLLGALSTLALQQWQRATRAARRAVAGETAARRSQYDADMNLAYQALAAHKRGQTLQLLERYRAQPPLPDLRHWEWRHLWKRCRSDALATICQRAHAIKNVEFTSDGQRLMVTDYYGVVEVWDLVAGRSLGVLPGGRQLAPAALAPRTGLVARLGRDPSHSAVLFWDIPRRQEAGELPLPATAVAMAFSPDERRLAVFNSDRTVRVYDLATRALSVSFPATAAYYPHQGVLAFSPDGQSLAVGEMDGRIRLVDATTGAPRLTLSAHPEGVTALAFSPSGTRLASGAGYADHALKLWDVISGREIAAPRNHQGWITSVAFSPDGQRLASASADQTVRLWDASTGAEIAVLRGHRHEVWDVAFSPDGRRLISGGKDGDVLLWDAHPEPRDPVAFTLPGQIAAFALTPEGDKLGTVSRSDSLRLWDLATGRQTGSLQAAGQDALGTVTFSPDGIWCAAGSRQGRIWVWDRASRRLVTNLVTRFPASAVLRFLENRRLLAALDFDGGPAVKLWDTASWQPFALVHVSEFTALPSFSRSGETMLAGSADGTVALWDLVTGRQRALLRTHRTLVLGVALSPDGRVLATGGEDGFARLWEVPAESERAKASRVAIPSVAAPPAPAGSTPTAPQSLATLFSQSLAVHSVAFSPDVRRLATGSFGKEAVTLWDSATWQEVVTLEGPGRAPVAQLAFSPDGNCLLALSEDGLLHVWRAPSLTEIDAAEPRGTKQSEARPVARDR